MSRRGLATARRSAFAPQVWGDLGSSAGVTLTLNADANSQSINVEVIFTEGTPGQVQRGDLAFREVGSAQAVACPFPMHALRPNTTTFTHGWNQLIGKILLGDGWQGKQVDVLATITVDGARLMRTATVTVRSEATSAYAAAATRYVSTTGDDTTGNGTSGAPWRSLEKARASCAANAVVEVAPGSYAAPTQAAWPAGVTIRAQNAAKSADNSKTAIAAASRTIVEPRGSDGWPAVSAPTGASDPDLTGRTPNRIAPWTQVTLTGPGLHGVAVADRVCWKWTASPITDVSTIAYHATRTGDLNHVNVRARVGSGSLTTAAGWLEMHRTNLHYSDVDGTNGLYADGCWSDGAGAVYLYVPGVADETHDPNQYYWTLGGAVTQGTGFYLTDASQTVAGFDLRGQLYGVLVNAPADSYLIERCVFQNNVFTIAPTGTHNDWLTTGVASQYPTHGTVRSCWSKETGLWSLDQATRRTVPWNDVKSSTLYADSTTDARSNGTYQERKFIGNTNGWKNLEVHDNVVDGVWDFANSFHDKSDQYACWGSDFWNNTVDGCADDAFDLSRWGGAQAAWGNRFYGCLTVIGMAPYWGTFLAYDNVAYQLTQRGSGHRNDGTSSQTCTFWKYGDSDPPGKVYLINNTVWSDAGGTSALTDTVYGANPAGGGAVGTDPFPHTYARNHLSRVTISSGRFASPAGQIDHDYCEWHDAGTNSSRRGLRFEGNGNRSVVNSGDWATYRSATGLGAHDNPLALTVISVTEIDAALANTATGDLTVSGLLASAGVRLPMLHDGLTVIPIGAISRCST